MAEKIILETTEKIPLNDFLRRELPAKIQLSADNSTGVQGTDLSANISNSKIRRLIVSGQVFVNGKTVTRPGFELRGKSVVCVEFDSQKFFYEKQPDDIKFEVSDETVLYEDENLIFLNKPSFFPVEQTITGNRDNLHDALVRYLWARNPSLRNPPYAGIMHRLDKETSGVILFTKTRTVNKAVSDLFQSHNFSKVYSAVVEKKSLQKNKVLNPGDSFTVEKFMGRISGKSQTGKWGSLPESKGGQFSKTHFTVLEECTVEGKSCLLISCSLFTGRTHQIRVHLSEAGFPILGDELYGGRAAKRIYLHASELIIPADSIPEIKKELSVKAPLAW